LQMVCQGVLAIVVAADRDAGQQPCSSRCRGGS
jgi:hypothetical protein